MDVERFLAGNVALGLVLVAVLAGLARANRSFLRDVARDPEAPWRALAWVGLAVGAGFVLWTTVRDNWRGLFSLPFHVSRRYAYERDGFEPTPDGIRRVTLVLLVLSLLVTAALVARHVGGYGIQVTVLLGAAILWAPLFVLRQRLDFNLALGIGDDPGGADVAAYGLFLVFAWLFDVGLALLCYAALAAAVALPVTLVLDVTRLRCPRTTGEAHDFFASLGQRADGAGGRR